jgi:integrase
MKKQWPSVKETMNHGSKVFLVDARINGKGERRFFATRQEAKTFADGERVKRMNEGTGAIFNAELAAFGWSVHEAINHALKFLRSQRNTMPLVDAVKAFLKAKEGQGVSARYIDDLRLRLQRFINAHPEASTGGITTATVSAFLRGLHGHATTKMNFRRDLHTFFEWCASEEIIDQDRINPVTRAATFDSKDEGIETITPKQFESLLINADNIILPAFILGGFCGVRQAEIARLDWSKIDLVEKTITIDASVAKTNARRTVTIPQPAIAWLAPLAKKSGPVLPPQPPREKGRGRKKGKWIPTAAAKRYQECREAWDMARLRAGFGPFGTALAKIRNHQAKMTEAERAALVAWPENCLRHSAISNRLALAKAPEAAAEAFGVKAEQAAAFVSMDAVADDAGNSRTTIKQHYDALSKPDTARRWFAIAPTKDGKVLQYSTAAA